MLQFCRRFASLTRTAAAAAAAAAAAVALRTACLQSACSSTSPAPQFGAIDSLMRPLSLQAAPNRMLPLLLLLLFTIPQFAAPTSPTACIVPPADPHSTCQRGNAKPCSGNGQCVEGVCQCAGDWIGEFCDLNAVTATSFMEPPPSPHQSCIRNAWRTQASVAFIEELERLHHPSRCSPSTALLHRNLETRQGLGAMMLFAVGALTMSMHRNMAAVCVGQFFYDSWGACKQRADFEPPLLCLFEPVWGCTSSALAAAANSSSAAPVQQLTSFDSSAYEVCSAHPSASSYLLTRLSSGCSAAQGARLLLAAIAAALVRTPLLS